MNTQKNAAWYRHQSWHRQTIIPALMPCSNGAWRFLPLPDRAKHKQKKARNYAGLAAFHAIRCLAVPDAESFLPDMLINFALINITDRKNEGTNTIDGNWQADEGRRYRDNVRIYF
ncbi:hypothetical protein AT328_004022 [Escherichia coli]|nr:MULTISPECIES: hypothetical protein [Enterobacteriaceae]EFQ0315400.1 hypothetical protein [Shigella flexneri]EHD3402084.1 hypothetical protein [Escherichia coli O152]EHS6105032.1 hypothetical protein [Salmonella enterica]EEC9490071.1 hypothetical protein [Escherichia coli]EEC9492651.1 hypothetical protein [Escherichia coli]